MSILGGKPPATGGTVEVRREGGWTLVQVRGSPGPAIRDQRPRAEVARELREAGLEVIER